MFQSIRRSSRKPRLNQEANRCFQIGFERRQGVVVLEMGQDQLAHGDQCRGTGRPHIDAAQQLLARRLGRFGNPRRRLGRRLGQVALGSGAQRLGIRRKAFGQEQQEVQPILRPERPILFDQCPRQRRTGSLALFAQQAVG